MLHDCLKAFSIRVTVVIIIMAMALPSKIIAELECWTIYFILNVNYYNNNVRTLTVILGYSFNFFLKTVLINLVLFCFQLICCHIIIQAEKLRYEFI